MINVFIVHSRSDKEKVNSFVEFLRLYVSVSGRMNKIIYKNRTIIIDFAHTPSSVTNVLSSLKEFTNHKITVVIGCGGNRDVSKRSIIEKAVGIENFFFLAIIFKYLI